MSIKLRIGPEDPNDENKNEQPKSGWAAFWETLGWIVFVLCMTAYCCRAEIVEVMR